MLLCDTTVRADDRAVGCCGGVRKVSAGSCANDSEPRGLSPVDTSPAEAFDSYSATRCLSALTSCSRLEVALPEAESINYPVHLL